MPSQSSFWKFAGFCFVLTGILLFCIIAGGYTNFYRSQNQIKATKAYLTDACGERLALLPGLVETAQENLQGFSAVEMNQTAEQAATILQDVTANENLLDTDLIKGFETTQANLTFRIKELIEQIKLPLENKNSRQFAEMKKKFVFAQNNIFISKKRYNEKVSYYNSRKNAFFISVIAKLFGFDKFNYIELSDEPFLPAHEIFETTAS